MNITLRMNIMHGKCTICRRFVIKYYICLDTCVLICYIGNVICVLVGYFVHNQYNFFLQFGCGRQNRTVQILLMRQESPTRTHSRNNSSCNSLWQLLQRTVHFSISANNFSTPIVKLLAIAKSLSLFSW